MSSVFHSRLSALVRILIALIVFSVITIDVRATSVSQSSAYTAILNLIHRQKYDEAITQLEQLLETDPQNGEALTYMATATLYRNLNFLKALNDFEKAFEAGGGATFFVTHSHEMFTTSDVVDYCRGWLHLRRDNIEFVPTEGTHGFKFSFNQVKEFKGNRLSKRAFHIKVGGKTQNFRGRSNTELEPVLIIALYKSFTQH